MAEREGGGVRDWHGLYSEGWTNEIVPDAFSHPAKFARGLIRRIYQHAIEEGWLVEGDTAVDPFAGVALGGLDAMFHGLHWVGCELEDKFVGLGGQNIALWNSRYGNGMLPRWGTAVILQGDSRQLCEVLDGARAKGIVASPPYIQSNVGNDDAENELRRLQEKAAAGQLRGEHLRLALQGRLSPHEQAAQIGYGTNPRNLGNMREGDHVKACISSPPYIGSVNQSDKANDADARIERKAVVGIDVAKPINIGGPNSVLQQPQVYGQSPGQLAAMPEGDVRAVVSSPPYQTGGHHNHQMDAWNTNEGGQGYSPENYGYGETAGQLQGSGDTFWSAAKVIISQCYQVLAPGGHAIWVVKNFVRNKEIVPFTEQWRELCESCGFETLHKHRCWLVEDRGVQYALNGDLVEKRVERKSFFRRLYETKARAKKFWRESVNRRDKARCLQVAHGELWEDYKRRVEMPDEQPPYPTRSRITSAAQMLAYKEAGEPDIEVKTQIDYEVVWCMRKPADAPLFADVAVREGI